MQLSELFGSAVRDAGSHESEPLLMSAWRYPESWMTAPRRQRYSAW